MNTFLLIVSKQYYTNNNETSYKQYNNTKTIILLYRSENQYHQIVLKEFVIPHKIINTVKAIP